MNPRPRAGRNLAIFWLVLLGLPIVLLAGCLVLGFRPCCTDLPPPTSVSTGTR
jgi:hypothetical protein